VAMAEVVVDGPVVVRERLEAFAGEVLGAAVNRPVQLANGRLYLRGLIEEGERKSLEPMVARLGGEADYESLQQFLAVSTWDPGLVVKAVAERVAGEIDVEAWVLDDAGCPKDGKGSPGVKRQYSRLVPPHRPRHRSARVPHPGAAEPKSPAAGLTLPQAVLLFQPLFKCWTGRCTTCHQPINPAKIPLHPPQHE
jgi:hypothetical protein